MKTNVPWRTVSLPTVVKMQQKFSSTLYKKKAGEIFNQYVKDGKEMNPPKITWCGEQTEAFNNEPICHICEKPPKEDDQRDADHCQYTGR